MPDRDVCLPAANDELRARLDIKVNLPDVILLSLTRVAQPFRAPYAVHILPVDRDCFKNPHDAPPPLRCSVDEFPPHALRVVLDLLLHEEILAC